MTVLWFQRLPGRQPNVKCLQIWPTRFWSCKDNFLSLEALLQLLLLLSCFSHVQLCETPWTAAHQALQSLGFSMQEHWDGLPFPSPMHESEQWKWSRSVVSDSLWPHGLQLTRLLPPWDFPGKSTGVGCHCIHIHFQITIYYFPDSTSIL